ncbi:MAG TPA: hypothetical protein DCO79_01855 [Spirochaeta sp.]|nr:hypothetical protein [Spirochaeta sp.]
MKKTVLSILILSIVINSYATDILKTTPENLGDDTLTYTYEEHYYDGIGESRLNISKTDDGYFIEWRGITDRTMLYTDDKFNTKSMKMIDDDTELDVERAGNELIVVGFDEGKKIDKTLKIDSEYWYQLMPAQLSDFVKTDTKQTEFSMFDPYNIQVMDMKVEKKGVERIEIGGMEVEAVKMNMRIQGLLSLFWKSELWYSTKSRLQVKYEGVNVIPKLYNAVIELKSADLSVSQ